MLVSYPGRSVRRRARCLAPAHVPGLRRPGRTALRPMPRRPRSAHAAVPPPGVDAWAASFAYRGVGARARCPGEVPEHPCRRAVARCDDGGDRARSTASMPPRSLGHPPPCSGAAAGASIPRRSWRGRSHAGWAPGVCDCSIDDPVRPRPGLRRRRARAGPRFVARRVAPSRVLLVDDVATTGATLAAAAAALRVAGARNVVVVTAARTPPPGFA